MESVAQGLIEDFATMESFVNETQWWDTVSCHAKMNNKSSGIVAEKKLLASPRMMRMMFHTTLRLMTAMDSGMHA